MPIIDLQRRLAEKGRIRLGHKKATSNGKTYPAKLDRLRFTSGDRVVIDALAARYGGDTNAWEGQWEVITETRDIDVMLIPTAMGFSQWYEDWTGAVCRKRCDGVTDHVRDCPCDCDPEGRTCKTTTRLSVMLPDLPGLGVWRLETHGHYAAVEIAAAVDMVELAAGAGAIIPARVRLEDRTVKRLIDGKVETRNFVVPVVDLDVSARQLATIGGQASAAVGTGGGQLRAPTPPVVGEGQSTPLPRALPPGETPAGTPPPPAPHGQMPLVPTPGTWQPVNQEALAPAPFVSVADQLDEVQKTPKPRKNAAAPIKPTGVTPRKAAEAVCHLCGEPYGEGALKKNPTNEGNRYVHTACADAMETPADPPAATGGEEGGGGGTATGPPPGGPAPAAAPRPLPHSMHKKLMAVTAEAIPAEGRAGADLDAHRKARTIAIAAQFGYDIKSRTDLTAASGAAVLDAMVGLRDGTYKWHNHRLVVADTGVVVGST